MVFIRRNTFGFFLVVTGLLGLHVIMLQLTQFIDWPELLLYPWLLHNHFRLYHDLLIPYQPVTISLLSFVFSRIGFSVASLRAVHLIYTLITDITLLTTLNYITKKRIVVSVAFLLYVLIHPTIEGNGLWFDAFLPLPLLLGFISYTKLFTSKNIRYAFWCGLALSFALIIKQTVMWILLVPLLGLVVGIIKKNQEFIKTHVTIFLCASILPIVQLLYYWFSGQIQAYIFWVYQFGFSLRHDPNYLIPINLIGDYPLIVICGTIISAAALQYRKWSLIPRLSLIWFLSLTLLLAHRWTLTHMQAALPFLLLVFASTLTTKSSPLVKQTNYIVIPIIFILGLHNLRGYVGDNYLKEPRFFNRETQQIVAEIDKHKGNELYYLYGDTEYYYVYLQEAPRLKPFVQVFPWNTNIPGVQEAIISQLETHNIKYIYYKPYHPQQPLYLGQRPELLTKHIEAEYKEVETIGPINIIERKSWNW